MHNREEADPAIDIMADIDAFFARSLDIAARAGIAARPYRARSRHRLRQDAGAEHHRHRAAGRIQIVRPAAPDRRLAQALHRQGFAGTARPAARRLDRRAICSRSRNGAEIVRVPRRRRDRAGAARRAAIRERPMSDAMFITGLALHAYHGVMQHEAQGRPDASCSISSSTSISPKRRAPTSSRTRSPTIRWSRIRERGVLRAALSAGRGRRRRGGRRRCSTASPRVVSVRVTVHKPHAPIAATFARCRRHHRAHPRSSWLEVAGIGLGRQCMASAAPPPAMSAMCATRSIARSQICDGGVRLLARSSDYRRRPGA